MTEETGFPWVLVSGTLQGGRAGRGKQDTDVPLVVIFQHRYVMCHSNSLQRVSLPRHQLVMPPAWPGAAGETPVCQGPTRCAPPAPDLLHGFLLTAVSGAPDTPLIVGTQADLDCWGDPGAAGRVPSKVWGGRRPVVPWPRKANSSHLMLSQRGMMFLAHSPHDLEMQARSVNAMLVNGVRAEILDAAQVREPAAWA